MFLRLVLLLGVFEPVKQSLNTPVVFEYLEITRLVNALAASSMILLTYSVK